VRFRFSALQFAVFGGAWFPKPFSLWAAVEAVLEADSPQFLQVSVSCRVHARLLWRAHERHGLVESGAALFSMGDGTGGEESEQRLDTIRSTGWI
jgi:hypothetical protein